ncbi:hypothetical protein CAQUA_06205 [Corynebacterium aquatimens]|nr:hypothetical protein CAQUA_06205 [Corynebacterium aquatimens]
MQPQHPQYPGAPMMMPAPKPKKQLTTEQKVLRTLAVLGSLITLIGVGYAVALAIQSGLIGPQMRAILLALFAFALLGIGIWVDRSKGSSVGVTALYITSFFVGVADIAYMTTDEVGWFNITGAAIAHAVWWLLHLAVAMWRKNTAVILLMVCGLIFYFYGFMIPSASDVKTHFVSQIITVLLIPLTVGATWLVPADQRKLDVGRIRTAAGVIFFFMVVIPRWTTREGIFSYFVVLGTMLLLIALLFVITELYAPIDETLDGSADAKSAPNPPDDGSRNRPQQLHPGASVHRAVSIIIVPALLALAVTTHSRNWEHWMIPVFAAVTLALIYFASNGGTNDTSDGSPENSSGSPERGSRSGSGNRFLMPAVLLFGSSFLTPYFGFALGETNRTVAQDGSSLIKSYLVLVIFALAFAPVAAIMAKRELNRGAVIVWWGAMLAILTIDLLPVVLVGPETSKAVIPILIRAVILFAIIFAVLSQSWLWRNQSTGVTTVMGAGFLYFSTLAMVNLSISLAGLVDVDAKRTGFIIGHAVVSVSWILIASWLLLTRKPPIAENAALTLGLILTIAASVKLVFFDLASLSGITRVLAFIVSGLLLLAVSVIRAQRNNEPQEPAPAAPGPQL